MRWIGLVSFLLLAVGCFKRGAIDVVPVPEPDPLTSRLRSMALGTHPETLGLSPTDELPNVASVAMEIGYPQGLATLVCLSDGSTSLYLGSGSGVYGAGAHESVRKAAKDFLLAAEKSLSAFEPTNDYSLPSVGEVRFYLRTYSGRWTAVARDVDLQSGRNELSDLYMAGHVALSKVLPLLERKEE